MQEKRPPKISASLRKRQGHDTEAEAQMRKLKEDLEKQRSVLKESALKEKEQAYQKKFRDYQLMVKDANEELQIKRSGAF